MPAPKRAELVKTCAHCGATFTRPDWKVWRTAVYCGGGCYAAARRSLPAAERTALMAEATARIRGSKRSHDDLCKRARTKQIRARLSNDELDILHALRAVGLDPVCHLAFDKINIDFAFPERMVAVEYQGGNWHNTPAKRSQDAAKADFLRASGWTLLVFPRLDKPQANDAGNRRVAVSEIVRQVAGVVHSSPPNGTSKTGKTANDPRGCSA